MAKEITPPVSLESLVASQPAETPPEPTKTETPKEEAKASETPPEPEAEEETEQTPEPEADDRDEVREYLHAIATERGIDLDLSKYKTGEDAVAGLLQAARRIGEKDADAEYGRQLRERIGGKESEILALLQGKEEPQPGKPTHGKDAPPEFDPAWKYQIVQDEKGQWVSAPGAPPDVPGKYRKYLEWRERQLDELARNPEGCFDKLLTQKATEIEAKAREAAQQETGIYKMQVAIDGWASQRAAKIYANGKDFTDGFSPLGQEIDRIQKELEQEGMTNILSRLARAEKEATYEMAQASNGKTKRVPSKAVRQPAIAPGTPPAKKSVIELTKAGKSLAEIVELQNA